jgi:predicted transposase/invertase (TIGR01784 family)
MKDTNKNKNIAATGQEKYTEDCILHYLEVPKLEGTPKNEIEKWLYFIEHGDKEDETVKVLIDKDAMFRAAKRRYEYFIADEKARIAYQQRSMFLHDQANYIYTARKEGLEEGREEGKKEEKRAIARKMKELGLSPPQISKATGLEEQEIETL